MAGSLDIEVLTGQNPALRASIPDLARLRITVFRDFPYLYDGTPEYEESYLETYLRCPESVVILVRDAGRVVGASTGLPLEAETAEFQQPFIDQGYDPRQVFYCAESVLLPEYRGRGVYSQFFKGREAHALRLGRFSLSVFCCVTRAPDHPLRPEGYAPLDEIWRRFGYCRHDELVTRYLWKDVDQPEDTEKSMVFWLKSLGSTAE